MSLLAENISQIAFFPLIFFVLLACFLVACVFFFWEVFASNYQPVRAFHEGRATQLVWSIVPIVVVLFVFWAGLFRPTLPKRNERNQISNRQSPKLVRPIEQTPRRSEGIRSGI